MDELCTACMCFGRKLYNLSETGKISEWTDFFYSYTQILLENSYFDLDNFTIRVCFECLASLKKWHKFKQQVQHSYMEILASNHLEPDQAMLMSKPPRLQINHVSDICVGVIKNEEFINADVMKHEDVSFNSDGTRSDDDVHHEQEMLANDLSQEKAFENKPRVENNKKKKYKKDAKKRKGKRNVKLKDKDSSEVLLEDLVTTDHCNDVVKILKENVENGLKTEDENLYDVKEEIEKFICADCGATFKFLKKLEYHVKKKHLKPSEKQNGGSVPVVKKPRRARSPEEVLDDKPTCKECKKTFSSKKTYRYHRNTLHKGNNRYPCPRCGKIYQWRSNLGRHLRSHKAVDNGELYCELCDKSFASVATYRQHLKNSKRHVTESEFSFMCNECGKKFVNKTRLRDHIDWDHLKKIKFTCSLCSKPFKCHTSLYVHMQNVHKKNKNDNLCHVCGKSYQNAAKLKYHIVAMHTTETPYQCEQCNSAFGWYSSLYRHIREVHYKMKLQPKKIKKIKKDLLPILPPSQPQQSLLMLPSIHHGPS